VGQPRNQDARQTVEYSDEYGQQTEKYDRANDEYDFTHYIRAHQIGGMDAVRVSHFLNAAEARSSVRGRMKTIPQR
jgi:hypothetical protein